jgi:hypothetical protein
MKDRLLILLVVTISLLNVNSVFASFADNHLVRIYYDKLGAEYGTDLGLVNTIIGSTNTTVSGSFTGANGTALLGAYFALDRTNNKLWVSGVNIDSASATFVPAIIGGVTGLTSISNGTNLMYSLYNTQGGAEYSGMVTANNSYKARISSTPGWFGNTVTTANNARSFSEAAIANAPVTQTLYYWANGLTTIAEQKFGIPVSQIATNADGSTTITPLPKQNGACGNAAGQPLLVKPVANLCASGVPFSMSTGATGPWSWQCNGQGIDNTGVTGAPVSCSTTAIYFVNVSYTTADPGIDWNSSSVTCDSPIAPGNSSVCAISPGGGFQLSALTDNGVDVFASVAVNSYTISNVSADHALVATFSSAATKTDQTIGQMTISPAKLAVGGTTTVSATATSKLPVSFTSSTPSTCTVSGTTVTGITAGVCTIAAEQAGNATFNAAPTVSQAFTVLNTQTIGTISFKPTFLLINGSTSVSATATSTLPITFSSATPKVCSVTNNTVTALATGTCTIAADQAGDASYDAAPQVTQNISVYANSQAIGSLSFTPPTLTVSSSSTVLAVANSGLAVTFGTSTPAICSVSGATINGLAAGTCAVTADQAGDATFAPAPQQTGSIAVLEPFIKINANTVPLNTLTLALAAPQADATILAQAQPVFVENAIMNNPVAITLTGGFDAGWNPTANMSVIQGSLMIQSGKLIVDGIAIR